MYIYDYIFLIVLIIAPAGCIISLSATQRRWLHYLQLEDYKPVRMLKLAVRNPRKLQLLAPELIGLAVMFIAAIVMLLMPDPRIKWISTWDQYEIKLKMDEIFIQRLLIGIIFEFIGALIWGFGCAWRAKFVRNNIKQAKKPLVKTARLKRIRWLSYVAIFFQVILVFSASLFIVFEVIRPLIPDERVPLFPLFLLFPPIFSGSLYVVERITPFTLAISVWLLSPLESLIQSRYLNDARRILSEMNPLVIGITGSYGKTGTKEMLTAMLAEKYSVFCPPGSYNTLMGVTRVIREQLRPYHELFVVEMGAYRIGSIRKLCDLVNPQYGIITIVGVQHLERFKTRENIKLAKGELIHALPDDGIAVLNGDDSACREIGAEFEGKVVYFRIDDGIADRNARATSTPTVLVKNIRIDIDGTDFDLVFEDDSFAVHLSLLGRSAVSNAAAAAAMADQLGVPRKAIRRALAGMPHVRHRLEPIRCEGDITVLDDAFNSNPIGARNALEVLATAKGGRKILVTPGMIELGKMEDDANREFGRQAASACDLIVLIGGKRVEPIRAGLMEKRFNTNNIWVAPSLNEGLERLRSYLKSGDTMLLENDLPDQYDST